MASFFEKLIGGQAEESSVRDKKPTVKRPVPKAVKKITKPQPLEEPEEIEEEEEKEVVKEEPKKTRMTIKEEPIVVEEPEMEEEEEPVKMAPKAIKKPPVREEEDGRAEGQLAIDVYQTDKEIVIQSTIAGVKPDNLEITIENGIVTIRGSRSQTESTAGKGYLIQECHWGSFSRQFVLPAEVDSSRSEAALKDGILTIKIPKIQKEKVTKLLVK